MDWVKQLSLKHCLNLKGSDISLMEWGSFIQTFTPENLSDFFPSSVTGLLREKEELTLNLVEYVWDILSKKLENAGGLYP